MTTKGASHGSPPEQEIAVAALVEDELILAVPYAPRHEDCEAAGSEAQGVAARASPFAGLKGLLRKH